MDVEQLTVNFSQSIVESSFGSEFLGPLQEFIGHCNELLVRNSQEVVNLELTQKEKIEYFYDVTELELEKAYRDLRGEDSNSKGPGGDDPNRLGGD